MPQQPPQANAYPRRTTSVMVRNGERTNIEGVDVKPVVQGNSVRLIMAGTPHEIIYQGSVEPSLYSPSIVVAQASLEKASNEYINTNKPDSTSMAGGAASSTATQPQAQSQSQNPLQVMR